MYLLNCSRPMETEYPQVNGNILYSVNIVYSYNGSM